MSLSFVLLVGGLILLIPTAYAAKIGAPWVPTRRAALCRAFEQFNIGEGDTVVDLGAGDGKVLLEAGKRGAKAIGYELSPIMWVAAWLKTRGQGSQVHFKNFYKQNLPAETTRIFLFLVPQTMPQAEQFLRQQTLPAVTHVFSYAFPFKALEPLSIIREKNCAPLYVYDFEQFKP